MGTVAYLTPVCVNKDGQGVRVLLLSARLLVLMAFALHPIPVHAVATGVEPPAMCVRRDGRPWTATPPSARLDVIMVCVTKRFLNYSTIRVER